MSNRPALSHDTALGRRATQQSLSTEYGSTAGRRYSVTYAFDSAHGESDEEPISLISETVAEMRDENVDIEFLGATQEVGPSGRTTELTARYSAPTEGTIGRLNCRASLPASGRPQRQRAVETGTRARGRQVAVPEVLSG